MWKPAVTRLRPSVSERYPTLLYFAAVLARSLFTEGVDLGNSTSGFRSEAVNDQLIDFSGYTLLILG
jgi:hypothetical protein